MCVFLGMGSARFWHQFLPGMLPKHLFCGYGCGQTPLANICEMRRGEGEGLPAKHWPTRNAMTGWVFNFKLGFKVGF